MHVVRLLLRLIFRNSQPPRTHARNHSIKRRQAAPITLRRRREATTGGCGRDKMHRMCRRVLESKLGGQNNSGVADANIKSIAPAFRIQTLVPRERTLFLLELETNRSSFTRANHVRTILCVNSKSYSATVQQQVILQSQRS